MNNVVRVVVADRHPIVRYGLLALLSTVDSISVVADVGNGEAAMRAVTAHRPDVLLVELSELHAITAIPGTALIVFTSRDDDQSLRAAIKAGAHGYILKNAEEGDIVRAIHTVAAGELIFGRAIADRLPTVLMTAQDDRYPGLTDRQREIADLAADGLGNAAIAQRLGLTVKTVRNNVSQILVTLGLSSRLALRDNLSGVPFQRESARA
jgi:DNA-binding NarL/FixJ family response regulator